MKKKAVVLFLLLILPFQLAQELDYTHQLIYVVNNKKTSWSARSNFPNSTTDDLKKMTRHKQLGFFTKDETGTLYHKLQYFENIPKFFDAREKWPECESIISYVRDQGSCASSWASTPAAVMSDRLCIESKGKERIHISEEDLIACCKTCSDFENSCDGGKHHKVWEYWRDYGIVSGGGYDSMIGCQPTSHATFHNGTSPYCEKRCTNPSANFTGNYTEEKRFGGIIYKVPKREKQIQIEIMTHGPVAAVMAVFEDFFFYDHGVYRHVTGKYVGTHVIKILGWGEGEKDNYWLAANTWGNQWGKLKGMFHTLRFNFHLGIGMEVRAGRKNGELSNKENIVNSSVSVQVNRNLLFASLFGLCFMVIVILIEEY